MLFFQNSRQICAVLQLPPIWKFQWMFLNILRKRSCRLHATEIVNAKHFIWKLFWKTLNQRISIQPNSGHRLYLQKSELLLQNCIISGFNTGVIFKTWIRSSFMVLLENLRCSTGSVKHFIGSQNGDTFLTSKYNEKQNEKVEKSVINWLM